MIPRMTDRGTRSLKIPALSGGINKRDGISLVQDNQLTDMKNMWYRDGLLKTRPSLFCEGSSDLRLLDIEGDDVTVHEIRTFEDIRWNLPGQYLDDALFTLVVIKYSVGDKTYLKPWLYSFDDTNIAINGDFSYDTSDITFFAYAYGKKAYLFVSGEGVKDIFELDGGKIARKLTDEDMYAPLVLTNGKPLGNEANASSGGDMIYGYNLLTRYYKAEYSTVDPDNKELGMIFTLPAMFGDDHGEGCTVKAEWTRDDGNIYTYEVVLDENGWGVTEEFDKVNGLKMRVSNGSVEFFDESDTATDTKFIKNNLTITAPGPYDDKSKDKVFNMTRAVWYGGAAYGIHGGSRLFLGGNTKDGEQALIVWSDLNDPLYFSENNYTYVGDKAQGVTAFGRQSSSLVIFKEREMLATEYQLNSSVTAEDLIDQTAVDLATQFAYFPMTQIHSQIGCDSPDTVQVCRNRLVWRFEGKIYTLTTQTQYSERNVFCVSEMIDNIGGRDALSVDCFGHYITIDENKAYVMDYNSYGFNYVTSYSKAEDANVKIPWYYWELPVKPLAVMKHNDELFFIRCADSVGRAVMDIITMSLTNDEVGYDHISEPNGEYYSHYTLPINSMIQTKMFDFGYPANLKNVNLVNITFGNNHGEVINVSFISEADVADERMIRLTESEENERSPKYLHNKQFRPFTKAVVRFGIKVECDGNLAIEAVTLDHKMLGGAR